MVMDYLLTFEDGSSAHLSHYGVKGMKWGVWNEETKDRYTGGKSRSTAAQTVRFKRKGRVLGEGRMGEVGGKTYKQSFKTSRAQRKAAKYLRRAVKKPTVENQTKATTWENKAKYNHYVDVGRSRGTRTAKTIGRSAEGVGGGLIGFGLASGNIPMAAVGAGTIAVGKFTVSRAVNRAYKTGYRLSTGKIEISDDKMAKINSPKVNR